MKAKELKIGDWVSFADVPVKVKDIKPKSVVLDISRFDDCMDKEGCAELGDIRPIPLTSEILEKNGWKERKYSERIAYENGWYELFRVGQEGAWAFCHYDDFLTAIKHIHELQHLLWALGMDDDLKI